MMNNKRGAKRMLPKAQQTRPLSVLLTFAQMISATSRMFKVTFCIFVVVFIQSVREGAADDCPEATAEACANQEAYCDEFFPRAAAAASDKCKNETYKWMVEKCRKACKRCCDDPRFNCEDSPNPAVSCADMVKNGLCQSESAIYSNIAKSECPASCGLCNSATSDCADTTENCNLIKGLCNNINFYTQMLKECKKTCNFCNSTSTDGSSTSSPADATATACVDLATNCAATAYLCNDVNYSSLMAEQCKKTCNKCDSSASGGSRDCTDSSSSCSTWAANGFCTSSAYTTEQKKQYCQLTCSLC